MKTTHPFTLLLAIAFGMFIVLAVVISLLMGPSPAAASDTPDPNYARALAGARTLRDSMRNPDSFNLVSAISMEDGSVCYEYRAQNGFGGMDVGQAVLFGADKLLTNNSAGFSAAWKRRCAGKSGTQSEAAINLML